MGGVTRRRFLRTAVVGAGAMAVGAPAIGTSTPARKPNLLVLWTDQQRFDTLAAYGNAAVRTPNLNRLAETSAVFERAYVSQPVCTPSRSTVLTGLWPHQNGCVRNNIPLRPDTKTLPELLDDADYATGYFGKWHLGDEIFAQHGFQEWAATEYYEAYYSEGRDKTAKPAYYHWLKDRGYKPDAYDRFGRQYCTTLPEAHCKPSFLAAKATDFLRRHKDRPFILHVNYLEPHNPFNGPLNELHDPASIEPPANVFDDLGETAPLWYRHKSEGGKEGWRAEDAKKCRDLMRIYWGMVAQVDRSVGTILGELERLGRAEDTIVVFTSDHGEMLGAHALGGKGVSFEESVRVPLLVRAPGLRKGRRVARPVSNIDLVPTLLDLMGSKAGRGLPGQSLVPALRGEAPGEDPVFVEWNARTKPPKDKYLESPLASKDELRRAAMSNFRMVVAPDGWKLCLFDADRPQLYHLARDPGETTNLAARPEHRDLVRRLTARLARWQEATGDTVAVT